MVLRLAFAAPQIVAERLMQPFITPQLQFLLAPLPAAGRGIH